RDNSGAERLRVLGSGLERNIKKRLHRHRDMGFVPVGSWSSGPQDKRVAADAVCAGHHFLQHRHVLHKQFGSDAPWKVLGRRSSGTISPGISIDHDTDGPSNFTHAWRFGATLQFSTG